MTQSKSPAPTKTGGRDANRNRLIRQIAANAVKAMAARSTLEWATDSGYPPALFAPAKTCAPNTFAAWGTVGTQGDPECARQLCQKALAVGMPEAETRVGALDP